jgi:type I phosphodiesterase/nucleotide pyrophosphatase
VRGAPPGLLLLSIVVLAAACTDRDAASDRMTSGARPNTSWGSGAEVGAHLDLVDEGGRLVRGSMREVACGMPRDWLQRTVNGYRPDRSGEIQLLPLEPNVLGSGLPHAGPWQELQHVPMFWYGPGFVRPAGVVKRPVTVADIAPTQAELLGFPFPGAQGHPLSEALTPEGERRDPPRLVVTMVWDAGGRDVLDAWPDRWSMLRELIPEGAWFDRATVGSSPSQTAQIHATIGTGTFPQVHGLVGHRLKVGPDVLAPWSEDPGYLLRPTLADVYDRAMGNEPVVGEIASLSIQLGMLGHGAMWGGADRDIVVIRQREDAKTLGEEAESWTISDALAPYYRIPGYVNDVGGLERDAEALDRADGALDGRWRNNDISALLDGFDTPARVPYQSRVIRTVMRREGFGQDEVPDLLFLNYKIIDFISHSWSMNSLEMADAVAMQDLWLRRFFAFLDRDVGEGEWAVVLTADHGATPSLDVTGGREISTSAVESALRERFDTDGDDVDAIEHLTHTQMFVDEDELAENGSSLVDVSRELMRMTKDQTSPRGVVLPPGELDDPVFRAAYPSELLEDLPCLEGAA